MAKVMFKINGEFFQELNTITPENEIQEFVVDLPTSAKVSVNEKYGTYTVNVEMPSTSNPLTSPR